MTDPDVPFQPEDVTFKDEDVTWAGGTGAAQTWDTFVVSTARTHEFYQAQTDRTRTPVVLVHIKTGSGLRIYSKRGLLDSELWNETALAFDGTWAFDGTEVFGAGDAVFSAEPRLLSCGTIREESSLPSLVGLGRAQARTVGHLDVRLNNDDDNMGLVLALDQFLGAELGVAIGYVGLRRDRFLTRWAGVVKQIELTRTECLLMAEAS